MNNLALRLAYINGAIAFCSGAPLDGMQDDEWHQGYVDQCYRKFREMAAWRKRREMARAGKR